MDLSFITTGGKFVVYLDFFDGNHSLLQLVQLDLGRCEHGLNCGLGVFVLLEKAGQLKLLVQLLPSYNDQIGMIILFP